MGERIRTAARSVAPALVVFALQSVLWPSSFGTLVSGLILGSLTALIALGMALIWRTNHLVTFAQADFGAVPATAAMLMMSAWSASYWVVLPLGAVVAAALGGFVEFAVMRRFTGASRLIATVATIGISQILVVAALSVPRLWGQVPTIRTFNPPFQFTMHLGEVVFDANDVMAALVAPVLMVAIGVLLRHTDIGIAVRAAAERPDRAAMLGVGVRGLGTLMWAVASALSFVGVFLTAGVTGLAPGALGSFAILLQSLAAMVFGRMHNLVTIVSTAIALGMLRAAMIRSGPQGAALVGPVLLGLILVALILQRRSSSRGQRDRESGWRGAAEPRPLSPDAARRGVVRAGRVGLGLFVAVVAGAPLVFASTPRLLGFGAMLIIAIVGVSVVVLSGWAGQVSLGQMAFVGFGGALCAWLIVEHQVEPVTAFVSAGVVGAVGATAVGLPALRLRGLALSVVTLALAVAMSQAVFDGPWGRWIPRSTFERPLLLGRIAVDSPRALYMLDLIALGLTVLAAGGIRRSRLGRAMVSQRDNELAASSFGISPTVTKLASFAVSGFFAAFAGSLMVFQLAAFRPQSFAVSESLDVFVATVLGGMSTPLGAVLGAAFQRGARWVLPGDWALFASAAGVLIVLIGVPDGVAGLWFRMRDAALRRVVDQEGGADV
jgi:branched-chain amino acid transport system permease protein